MSKKDLIKFIEKFGYELDDEGQIVVYTGLYMHDDGKISSESQ